MKKRILSIFIALVLAFSGILTLNAFAAAYSVSVSDIEIEEGKNVTVEVKLDTAVENAINASFSLKFDPEVLQIAKDGSDYKIEAGPVFEGFTMLSAGNNTQGYANFGGTAAQGSDIAAGVIYTVEFEVLKEEDPNLVLSVNAFALDKEDGQAKYPSIVSDTVVEQAEVTIAQESSGSSSSSSSSSSDSSSSDSASTGSSSASSESQSSSVVKESSSAQSSSQSQSNANGNTGDNMPIILIGALIAVSLAVAVIVIKKRQNN